MLGSLILYLKGMRIMMFQLSGFYFKALWLKPDGAFEASAALLDFPSYAGDKFSAWGRVEGGRLSRFEGYLLSGSFWYEPVFKGSFLSETVISLSPHACEAMPETHETMKHP